MKQKVFAVITAVVLICSLAACGSSERKEVTGAIRLPIPEEFTPGEMEGVTEFYQTEDGSNINMLKGEPDPTIEVVEEQELMEVISQAYEQQLGATVELVKFSDKDILGCPAYQVAYKVSLDGLEFTQYQMAVQSDALYTWTLTDMTGQHIEAFEDCLELVYLDQA